jgi:solute carrier family 25 phosphate transporter 23/24/25/41
MATAEDGSQTMSAPFQKILSGGTAGVLGQTIVYPLEVIKTRLALSPTLEGGSAGIVGMARTIVATDGLRGLYRGLVPSTIGIFPYASIDLAVFSMLKETWAAEYPGETPSIPTILGFGATSSTCGAVFAYPLQTVRTRLQAQGMANHFELQSVRYHGMLDCFSKTVATDGVAGLYRGLLPNLLKVLPAVSISWAVFEKSKQALFENGSFN